MLIDNFCDDLTIQHEQPSFHQPAGRMTPTVTAGTFAGIGKPVDVAARTSARAVAISDCFRAGWVDPASTISIRRRQHLVAAADADVGRIHPRCWGSPAGSSGYPWRSARGE